VIRHYLNFASIVLMLLVFVVVSRAQNRTLYFSNQYRADAALMPQTDSFTVDDPIYVVLNLSRGQNTIGDLVSTDPVTGEKNFWLCFSPEPAAQNYKGVASKCVGILPQPLTDGILYAKAVSYKILPAGSELARNKTDLSEGVLSLMAAYRNLGHPVAVPFTYYIYGKADRPLKAGEVLISCQSWDTSATGKYISDADAKADSDELAGRKTLMTKWVADRISKRTDPALEKAIQASNQSPILRIVFLTPGYDIIRNDLGIVVRKSIRTLYVYKWIKTGKCYAYWYSYGYESLGGAAFNTDLGSWRVFTDDGSHVAELNVPGTNGFPSGDSWEVDCAASTAERPGHKGGEK
jgi:hypothetical protein